MSGYPGAISWPAHPSNIGSGVNHPKVIVYHTPEEPADGYPGTPYWFAQQHPGMEGSTHAFDSYLGFIWQCVEEEQRAIANGVTPGKPYPAGTDPNISLNLQSISIEIEGYAASIGQTLSQGQRKALVDWTVYACKKYGIPADRQHIIGHYEVASNRSDPGTLPIDDIVAEVAARLAPVEEESDMKIVVAKPSGRVFIVGAAGKRYIDDLEELALYNLVAGAAVEVTDAQADATPDIGAGAVPASGPSGTYAITGTLKAQ